MKKLELTQLIMDSAGLQFGNRTAERHIALAFNSICGQLFAKNPNSWEFYCKRILLPVVNRVSKLTVSIIETRTNANGVVRIMPTGADAACEEADGTEFYACPSFALHSDADANHTGFVFYTATGNTIRFNKALPSEVTSVLADVVVEYQEYEDSDQISLPTYAADAIVDAAVAAIKGDKSFSNIYKTPKP